MILFRLLSLTPLLFFALLGNLYGEESLRLEGIVYDPDQPNASIALINGDALVVGAQINNYELVDVQKKSAKLRHTKTGETLELQVLNAQKKERAAKMTLPHAQGSAEPEAPRSFTEQIGDFFSDLKSKPAQLANRAIELKALFHLATISNASVRYYEKNSFFPQHLDQLILDGFLDQKYKNQSFNRLARDQYLFYFDSFGGHPDKMGIHADPEDNARGLRFFFIGPDAVIREQQHKPATQTSEKHNYIK